MAIKMEKIAYTQLIKEDLEWLREQPRTLERDHIIQVLLDIINVMIDQLPPPSPGE